MNTNKREFDVRRAILSLDLTTTERLILLTVLIRVDWTTFAGEVSAIEISSILNLNIRTVQRAFSKLKKRKYISRFSEKIGEKNKIALTQINTNRILKNDTDVTDTDVASIINDTDVTDTDVARNDTGVARDDTDVAKDDTDVILFNSFNSFNLLNREGEPVANNENDNDVIKEKDQKLNEWQVRAIERQVKKTGDDSFANRKRIAKRLFRIQLLKGGYYEKI
jgi:hypothetical protein